MSIHVELCPSGLKCVRRAAIAPWPNLSGGMKLSETQLYIVIDILSEAMIPLLSEEWNRQMNGMTSQCSRYDYQMTILGR